MARVVQKYGGASLSDTKKLKAIAQRILKQRNEGDQIIVVVSAMDRTTDNLHAQVKDICLSPADPGELDVVLSTGEILSAALLSLALNSIGCAAKSFTGAQAGIITDKTHSNASINQINTQQIETALQKNIVVVVAGFQGVTDLGNTTTLGRGGSDTTAVALAACLNADRCEILKDVPAIFSANPNVVSEAFPIQQMSYGSLLEMTFWGAKVLNYRAVEIAHNFSVPLYVGPAHLIKEGTFIKDNAMIENSEILSLNSHETILRLDIPRQNLSEAFLWLENLLALKKIVFPQILLTETLTAGSRLYATGPKEVIEEIIHFKSFFMNVDKLCSVTATCRGTTRPDFLSRMINLLKKHDINISCVSISSLSITLVLDKSDHDRALEILHQLVEEKKFRSLLKTIDFQTLGL